MKLNIFELAALQLHREGKSSFTDKDLIRHAMKIRKWLNIHNQNVVKKILQGETIYKYNNKIEMYARAI
jgi:hypothetical protein